MLYVWGHKHSTARLTKFSYHKLICYEKDIKMVVWTCRYIKKCSRNVMVSEEGKRYNLWPTSWPAEMSGVKEREIINSTYSAFTNVSVCSCANRE